jgi:PXPV repeat-containing protein
MKRLGTALVVAILPLLPVTAWAGSSTDAALGLGAFAVFNQILGGTGIFAGLGPARPVYAAPPAPVYVAPPPPVYVVPQPVYAAPRRVYVAPRPVYVVPQPVYVAPRPVYVAPRPVIVYRSAVPVYARHAGFKHWNHGPHR